MKKNNKTPKLRFSGYTDDWEQRKFADFTWDAGKRNKEDLDLEPYAITNEHGFIRQCDAHDDFGYMKDTDRKAYNIVQPNSFAYNPARINVGSIGYYKGVENVIVSSLYEVFQTDNYVNDRFLWHWFKSDEFPRWIERLQEGSVRLYFYYDKLCECQLYMPSLEEQEKIASFLDALDHLITLHQRKLEKLQNMKKSCLQKMFPKDGATVPEIRFSEFQGDWEERTLGSCFDERLESLPDGELLSVTIGSGIKKFSELDRHDTSNTDKSKYKRVCIGDIAYNSMRMWQGASGFSPYEGIVSPAYTVVKPNEGMDSLFFAYMFKKKNITHLFEINSQGLTSDTWNLKYPAFSKIVVRVPDDIKEQRKIAGFLQNLDEMIMYAEQELELTKRMKKGCLQKMFV